MKRIFLSICLAVALRTAQGQPAPAPGPSPQPLLAAQKRALVDPSSFVYKFNPAGTLATSVFGSVQTLFASDSPALLTLNGDGIGQAVINLNPCALWAPHLHPRANEILYVAQGNLTIGFKEENQGRYPDGRTFGGRLLNFTVPQGSSMIAPQGLMHYMLNNNCEQASVVTSFDDKDPGTVTVAQQIFSLPTEIISAAIGLDEVSISLVQSKLSQQNAVSFSPSCMSRCGLPIPAAVPAPPGRSPTPVAPPVQATSAAAQAPASPANDQAASPQELRSKAAAPSGNLSTSSGATQVLTSSG